MFSQDIELVDKHMGILERHAPKFQAADRKDQETIVRKVAEQIKSTWTKGVEFERDTVIGVCDLSDTLDHSEIFLAYLQVSVWQT